MNKRFFIILLLCCAIMIIVAIPSFSSDLYSLPANVVSFYESAGNHYLDSLEGSFQSLDSLMGASLVFYAPIPESVVFSYIRFGEVLISAGESSTNGLAGIGNLVLSGADKALPWNR